jgi:hypothetical protein
MVAVTEKSDAQAQAGTNEEIYAEIANAIVEKRFEDAHRLMVALCKLRGPEHVARALTVGGRICTYVRRTIKPMRRSEDPQERLTASDIIGDFKVVALYAPTDVVNAYGKLKFGLTHF